ncbi:MAG: GNAT family acetyltransferase, partial [Halobacteriota archaeon]|nr:GNAT family acetyltransferase [Halobacteriota archaeon]
MNKLTIRTYQKSDGKQIINLWSECDLTVPWNNPKRDIERKMNDSPSLFLVGEVEGRIVCSCMAGYDGHRGWIYYLAVNRDYRREGIASRIVREAENRLLEIGCPKIDLMVRRSNKDAVSFYNKMGYGDDPVIVLSKRLYEDE